MTRIKFLVIVVNLVLLRLATQTLASSAQEHLPPAGAPSVLESINSLDFSAGISNANTDDKISEAPRADQDLIGADSIMQWRQQQKQLNTHRPTVKRRRSGKATKQGSSGFDRRQPPSTNNLSNTIASLIGQLERLDVKRLITDSVNQMARFEPGGKLSSPFNHKLNLTLNDTNRATPNDKARVNVSAVGEEAGNLMSITKQIVKLARSQMLGPDYGTLMSPGLMSPSLMMPSMLSAASHMLHDTTGHEWGGSGLGKSEWFWVVVPAVIVIGAGVIVVPLIAAWIVSHMMNQNTFTVSAGRRRRRRDVHGLSNDPLSFETTHKDLFKMLDIHRLLTIDDPQLLANKLAKLHQVLSSVGETFGMSKSSRKPHKN